MPPYAPLCRGFFLRLSPGASMRPRPGLPQASKVEREKEQPDKNEGEQRGRIHWPRKAAIPEERRRREKGPGPSLISRTGRATQGKGAHGRDVTSKALRKKHSRRLRRLPRRAKRTASSGREHSVEGVFNQKPLKNSSENVLRKPRKKWPEKTGLIRG